MAELLRENFAADRLSIACIDEGDGRFEIAADAGGKMTRDHKPELATA